MRASCSSVRTWKDNHVGSLFELRRVVVEIGDTHGEVGRGLVNSIAGDHLESVLGARLGVQTLPQDDLAAVAVDAERSWTRQVPETIRQHRRAVDVVRRDGSQHGTHGGA